MSDDALRSLYLNLMKQCLLNSIYGDRGKRVAVGAESAQGILGAKGLVRRISQIVVALWIRTLRKKRFDSSVREEGRDWPSDAHTMIGLKRLENIQFCIAQVLADDVPGDLIETGVWRGGATIFMRAVLKAYGVTDRNVWVADSFEGLPKPDSKKYEQDAGDTHYWHPELAVSLDQVKDNFRKYDLLDEQVQFLKGYFRDTLPSAPMKRLAVLRLDGDMYESTMDALVNLYPRLSIGGYVIIDDYGAVPACLKAVRDFRDSEGITEEIETIDWSGVFWRRSS